MTESRAQVCVTELDGQQVVSQTTLGRARVGLMVLTGRVVLRSGIKQALVTALTHCNCPICVTMEHASPAQIEVCISGCIPVTGWFSTTIPIEHETT